MITSKIEIVINTSYGGFSLSGEAMRRYNTLKGTSLINGRHIERTDPVLIEVVKALGDKANGECAELRVVEFTLGFNVYSYDGKESVDVGIIGEEYWGG